MISSVCGNHIKIEEYQTGRLLTLGYWNSTTPSPGTPPPPPFIPPQLTHSLLSYLLGGVVPQLTISVDTSSKSHCVITTHSPHLTGDHHANVEVGKVCLEEIISECVRVRAIVKLKQIKNSLKSTVWEDRGIHTLTHSLTHSLISCHISYIYL